MSALRLRPGRSVPAWVPVAMAALILGPALDGGALAQTNGEREGLTIREVRLSNGYASVRLPPVTLGGHLPPDILHADLITSGTAAIDWRRIRARTRYALDVSGTYTARARHAGLNAPTADVKFEISHAPATRWRLAAGVANALLNSDEMALHQLPTRPPLEGPRAAETSAGVDRLTRQDPTQDSLFVPIAQSFTGSPLEGARFMMTGAKAEATYRHSVKLAARFHGSYTAVGQMSSTPDREQSLIPRSNREAAGLGVSYRRTERTRLTADLHWSATSGASTDKAVTAAIGYGWSGQRWFAEGAAGVAVRPFHAMAAPAGARRRQSPEPVYHATLGYGFQGQMVLVQYSRTAHDDYGHGGINMATGFEGHVQSVAGTWVWWAPRGNWLARSDFSLIQRPGNFSYIYAWLSATGVGRQVGPNVRLMGEALFDRHGSRAFEGFHLMRGGARVTLVWTPRRRSAG